VLAPDAQILGTLRRAMMGNKEDKWIGTH
jgi:hypothetical protein